MVMNPCFRMMTKLLFVVFLVINFSCAQETTSNLESLVEEKESLFLQLENGCTPKGIMCQSHIECCSPYVCFSGKCY